MPTNIAVINFEGFETHAPILSSEFNTGNLEISVPLIFLIVSKLSVSGLKSLIIEDFHLIEDFHFLYSYSFKISHHLWIDDDPFRSQSLIGFHFKSPLIYRKN